MIPKSHLRYISKGELYCNEHGSGDISECDFTSFGYIYYIYIIFWNIIQT